MRKLIVKHFALDFKFKIFGKQYNTVRASRVIMPLMMLCGITLIMFPNSIFLYICYTLLAISLFFGFVYFRFYPVKFDELDEFQKWQYGKFMFDKLLYWERKEWEQINKKYEINNMKKQWMQ